MFRAILLIAILAFAGIADAQTPCPICGQIHARQPVRNTLNAVLPGQNLGSGQAIAQARANYMARHDLRTHPPQSAGNFASVGTFEGVGWTSDRNASQQSVSTCVAGYPRVSRMAKGSHAGGPGTTLVGDAIARGPRGTYRVRIWR